MDADLNVIEERYTRTKGEPLETSYAVLDDVVGKYGASSIRLVGATGSGGKLIAPLLGATFVNEVIAQSKATEHFHPDVRTVIEMGGQDAKLILLDREQSSGKVRIEDFEMNSVCAAGTGSFLDQQATRMGLTIEEMGELALRSKHPPRVAGRCSVFAKSDMIHLQQVATPDYDIVAGLCYAVARNFKATIGKGKEFTKPVAFQGGVAANPAVRKAFVDVLELKGNEFVVPKHFASMGAIGAVLYAVDKQKSAAAFRGLDALADYIRSGREKGASLARLHRPDNHPSENVTSTGYRFPDHGRVDVYLGLDIGSTSTNVVLLDRERKLVSRSYLRTAGRPLEAVRQGLADAAAECGDRVNVIGVGSTGSGRYLIGDFVGADVVRNEITAQATAAVAIDPEVDTIFEIGGQDSKYISLDSGVVVDFEMNKVCAAGTGSFLEEQAERLGISIKGQFSDMAIGCGAPASMGERCTVFIESDMVHHQQSGVEKDGLVSGLAYSIVYNYLNRVVGDRRVGNKIFFQGGTAANLAVVSAFEKVTGKKITVPENHDVTGAIGVAILAMSEMAPGVATAFKGFDLSKRKYSLESFECRDCSNICEIRKVVMEGEDPLYYGGRCEKYDVKLAAARKSDLPDLYKERERLLYSAYRGKADKGAPEIGVPRVLMMHELYPFWKAFFTELGFRMAMSSPTNKQIIKEGVEKIVSETCFPVKVAHGHIKELVDRGVKKIFLPSVINMRPAKDGQTFTVLCPYVQSLPYMSRAAFDYKAMGVDVLSPVIHFNQSEAGIKKEFLAFGKTLGKGKADVTRALDAAFKAQDEFKESLLARGREVLSGLKQDSTAVVIVGRAYNTADPGINLEIPQKLRDLKTLAIPYDMLPLDDLVDDELAEQMYWKSGQRILAAAHLVRNDARLYALYITNFGCGPDSFITHFFKVDSKGKPFLQLEIDEHSADAGAITRCEAFLDSIRNIRGKALKPVEMYKTRQAEQIKRKLYIPDMADGSHAIAAAFQACGIDAEVIPHPDEESLKIGRAYTSGRECYPNIITTGDMVKMTRRKDFDPKNSAFFMPSGKGPCRFGQYNRYHRMILDELGFKDVPVYAPDQDESFYSELKIVDGDFKKYAWWGIASVDLLEKKLRETRPYEKNRGDSERVYWESVRKVCAAIRQKKFPDAELSAARDAFRNVAVVNPGSRPVIGVVGEIYVRSNRFSNENLVEQLEALGAEVRVPPVGEWIYYTNHCAKTRTWQRRKYGDYVTTVLTDFFQHRYEKRLEDVFKGDLRNCHEPTTRELIELAAPYIDESFEGEAVLSVGKVIDYLKNGAHGIVNAMPFTCMPGTVVNAVLKSVRDEHASIPYMNMVFEGLEDTNMKTRMEAFVYQAREYMERRRKAG
jgi:predicted CoA-substrate-specific enzyme activase